MRMIDPEGRQVLCRHVAGLIGVLIAAMGCAVLLGWAFDWPRVKSVLPGTVTMKANTALCFLLAGVSLRLLSAAEVSRVGRWLAGACALVVSATGLLTLAEYALARDFGLDQILFREDVAAVATSHPGRMAPNTALCFLWVGLALAGTGFIRRRKMVWGQGIILVVMLIGLLAVISYAYGVPRMRTLTGPYTHMAVHTGLGFLLLALGILFANPGRGLMLLATRNGAAGLLMRRLLPAMVALLILLGLMRLAGERLGWYSSEEGTALFVAIRIAIISAVIYFVARIVHRAEETREQARRELAALNDTLEQRVAQRTAELRETQARLQEECDFVGATIETMGALVVVLDREGRVVRFNRACEETTGYRAAEVLGRPFWDMFILPEELEGVRGVFNRLSAGDFPLCYENYWLTKSGGRCLIAWANACLTAPDGTVAHVIGTGIDVTERRRAEDGIRRLNAELEERVQSRTAALNEALARLEHSNRELEQFAYVASHDLQEPLRKISAFSSLLVQECASSISPDGRDYLNRILNAVKRMQTLISDLLQLSRISTRAGAFVGVDLNGILRDVLADLEARLRETGGTVEVAALPVVEAEPTQMRQLFQNLVANALKFHKPDQPPRIRVFAAARDAAGDRVTLKVEDHGIGFEPQFAERIFGLFQRLHGREEYEGTGIGLTICRRIAERHGGRITAEGRPGDGATFSIELPVRQAQPREGREPL